jgi:uncharacterized protein with GYD domain
MVTYVSLINWTEQGIKSVKDTVERAEKATHVAEQLGGRITSILWTQGSYDLVVTTEFPDEDSAQVFALGLGSTGNIRTETLRAFSATDMKRIISKLP